MDTKQPAGGKPNDTQTSRDIVASGGTLAELLTSPDLGARVKGLLLSVSEVKEYSGKNQDGSSYRSFSRRMEVFSGPKTGAVVCGERSNNPEDLKPLQLGASVLWPIIGAKTDGKQLVFRVDTNAQ